MSSPYGTPDVTSDDKLWAALAYVFTPIVPIIIMVMEDKKNRPFLRAHNAQALAWGVAFAIISILLSMTVIGGCLVPFIFLVQLYWGYKAYQGEYITIPVITDFVKKQGWA